MNDSPFIDKVFRRVKDSVLVIGIVWAIFSKSMNFYGMPEKVERVENQVGFLDKQQAATILRVQAVEQSAAYISKSLDEIKAYQIETFRRINTNTNRN